MKHNPMRIAAITMARNDEFFLNRWISYYGEQFGEENLYIYLDGLDQKTPARAGDANIKKLPHKEEAVQRGDKTRILLLSDLARKLFADGYDIVVGCDCDEFLIVDPKLNMTLGQYLATRADRTTSLSGFGMDVGMDTNTENVLDEHMPMLAQRKYALMSTRYTKPVVLFRPATWGSGFHSVKGRNFHIDKNLYLLHFGSVDFDMIKNKISDRNPSWEKHLKKRARTIDIITRAKHRRMPIKLARFLQRIFRPVYDWNKPAMLGLKWVTEIPTRFINTGI